MILHTLNASPSSSAFADCLKTIAEGDAVVLMGDGVYAAIAHTDASKVLEDTDARLYIMTVDALAAGVVNLSGAISGIDMNGFVTLTEEFSRQQAWY